MLDTHTTGGAACTARTGSGFHKGNIDFAGAELLPEVGADELRTGLLLFHVFGVLWLAVFSRRTTAPARRRLAPAVEPSEAAFRLGEG